MTPDPAVAAAVIALICLALWLTEATAAFVPTLILLAALPLCGVSLAEGLGWMADPVLVLFFGGFALGEACAAHGIDRVLVGAATRVAGGSARVLLVVVVATTAFLSMWMSNVAAAALMLASLRPVLATAPVSAQRGLLVGLAMAANLGGMATPIGTGPNAIAIAALDPEPSFVAWMALALPLTIVALAVATGIVAIRHGLLGDVRIPHAEAPVISDGLRPGRVATVAIVAIVAWLTEPLHGVPAPVVSVATAAALFGSGLLPKERLARLDWSTLVLVAGGIGLGRLLEHAGWLDRLALLLVGPTLGPTALVGLLLALAAGMSALMSNTATATLLVPIATTLFPDRPGVAILIALAASFGMPFVVSTPPNAMVVGAGARSSDLLLPGLILMAGGCLVLATTGPTVLAWFGY